MTPTDGLEYERPLEFVDVLYVIADLIDELERDHNEIITLEREDNDGYPTRSLGGGGGGPSNIVHDFTTGKDENTPDAVSIPQHSDPVGELVAHGDTTTYKTTRRRAFDDICGAMRLLESARSRLTQTRRPPINDDTPRARDHCWPCMDTAGVKVPVYRDSDPTITTTPRPRCRNHYDYARAHRRDAPASFAEWWFNRRRITTSMWDQAHQDQREQRSRNRKKKRRR